MRRNESTGGKSSRSVMDNNKFVFVLSLLIAVVCWAAVSMVNTQEIEKKVSGVKVQIDADDVFENYGLSLFDQKDYSIDVTLKGASYLLRGIDSSSIVLTASCANVTAAGSYDLQLISSLPDYPTVKVTKVNPSTVKAYFDEEQQKPFPVTEDIVQKSGYAIAEGYERENPVLSPDTVIISGASRKLSKITAVKARVELNKTLNAKEILEAELILESDEGELDKNDFTIQPAPPYYITIPVSYTSTCNATVEFTNKPAAYKTSMLPWTVAPSTVEVKSAVSEDSPLTRPQDFPVGEVDFSEIAPGEVNTFTLKADAGSGEIEFEVEIDATDFTGDTLSIPVDTSNITLPANVRVTSSEVAEVAVAGPEESVAALDRASVYAVPVLDGLNALSPGQHSVPAKIVFRTATDCWAYGKYTVDITVQ